MIDNPPYRCVDGPMYQQPSKKTRTHDYISIERVSPNAELWEIRLYDGIERRNVYGRFDTASVRRLRDALIEMLGGDA